MEVLKVMHELVFKYGYEPNMAKFMLRYTADDTVKPSKEWKTPSTDGFITLRYIDARHFGLEDHTEIQPRKPRKGVAIHPRRGYTRESKVNLPPARRDSPMPAARGRRAAQTAPPEPDPEENGAVDFQRYLDKDLSPTMTDYVTWFEENVAALEDVPVDKLLALGSSLYPHFQKSDFNISQREARKSARAPEPEPEPEPEPVRRGRGRPPKAAAAAPTPAPAPAPARRGRPRGSGAKATAGAEAPY
jgi:hypothetical protein